MLSPHSRDIHEIYDALLAAQVDDVELTGNALTALVGIVARQQSEITRLQERLHSLECDFERSSALAERVDAVCEAFIKDI